MDGRDGVFAYVELSYAVTPVARGTLLSAQRISSSSIDNMNLATDTQVQFLILQLDVGTRCSDANAR